jgi:hypothetical protein
MFKLSVPLVILCTALGASAQPRPPAPAPVAKPQAQIDAMARLSWLAGEWEGSASFTTPAGSRQARSSERVLMGAGGTALLIHGLHRNLTADGQPGDVVHDAMALLVFDEKNGKYRVSSQTKEGRGGHFEGRMEGDTFQWFIPFPGGHMRYDIRRGEAGEWLEQGHFCRDGSPCMTTMSMTLQRRQP